MRGILALLSMTLIMGCATEIETFEELVERLDATEQEIRAKQEEIQVSASQEMKIDSIVSKVKGQRPPAPAQPPATTGPPIDFGELIMS